MTRDTDTSTGGECPTCQRLNYEAEYLAFCDVLNGLGKTSIDEAIFWAMERAQVKRSRREHVGRAIRFFIGEIRKARP